MELKDYLAILWRRWYYVVAVPLLVLVGVIYQFTQATTTYTATARLAVTRAPDPMPEPPSFFRYDDYYTYLASEYLIDDLVEMVRGNVFANDVAATLAAQGVDVSPGEIQGSINSDRINRIISLHIRSGDAERAILIAQAAATTLEEKAGTYFNFNVPRDEAIVTQVEVPEQAAANTQRQQMLLLLQVLVGVFAGVLIAFLIDYLDDTLRSPETVSAALDLPVIGIIPDGGKGT